MQSLRLTNDRGVEITGIYLKQFSAGTEQTVLCWNELPFPRFQLIVHDTSSKSLASKKILAVFVTPQGQERGWSFSTSEGREQLLRMVKCSRLVVVHLGHAHTFQALTSVQAELANTAILLKPQEYPDGKITFYTNGDIGRREIIHQRDHYLIEEVTEAEKITRQLLFTTNINDVQSEVRMTAAGAFDFSYLPFECQRFVIAGLTLVQKLQTTEEVRVSVLGTGAGVLPMFLRTHFPSYTITSVDIDPTVPSVLSTQLGKNYFGLQESPRLQLLTMDAVAYIEGLSQQAADVDLVIIDINGAGPEDPCPPQPFKTFRFMQLLRDVLADDSLLVVNSSFKGGARRSEMLECLKDCFSFIYSGKCEEEANEVFFVVKSQSRYIPKAHSQLRTEMLALEEAHRWHADMDLPEVADRVVLQFPVVEETVPPTPEPSARRRKNKKRR